MHRGSFAVLRNQSSHGRSSPKARNRLGRKYLRHPEPQDSCDDPKSSRPSASRTQHQRGVLEKLPCWKNAPKVSEGLVTFEETNGALSPGILTSGR